jgi:hypothetical protein
MRLKASPKPGTNVQRRSTPLDRGKLDLDQPRAPVVIGTFRAAREQKMNFNKRAIGFSLLWFAILVVLMVWLYGVVHH